MLYAQIAVVDMNKIHFAAAYQLSDYLVIELGYSSFMEKTMQKIAGVAMVDATIRYQIKAWNR